MKIQKRHFEPSTSHSNYEDADENGNYAVSPSKRLKIEMNHEMDLEMCVQNEHYFNYTIKSRKT